MSSWIKSHWSRVLSWDERVLFTEWWQTFIHAVLIVTKWQTCSFFLALLLSDSSIEIEVLFRTNGYSKTGWQLLFFCYFFWLFNKGRETRCRVRKKVYSQRIRMSNKRSTKICQNTMIYKNDGTHFMQLLQNCQLNIRDENLELYWIEIWRLWRPLELREAISWSRKHFEMI